MKKLPTIIKWSLLIAAVLVILPSGCGAQTTPTPPVEYSLPELKYRLISNFDELFYVDPDYYPIAREGQEEKNALEQFPSIKADTIEFSAILKYLAMSNKAEYTNEEKLLIYRQHKKLTLGVQMTASGDVYQFTLRVREGEGELIEGTITPSGKITVLKRETSFNTYPICLARGTMIDTPDGPVPVEQFRKGMVVWTADHTGKRTPSIVIETAVTQVPLSFQITRLTLNDGRVLIASAGHPTAEGRVLGDYGPGDTLDGALVAAVEQLGYDGVTYDLLPSGETALYWANRVLLKSTLATN